MTLIQPMITPNPIPTYQNLPRSTSYGKHQNSADYFSRSGRSSPAPSNSNGSGSAPWLNSTQVQEEPTTGEIGIPVGLGPKPAKMSEAEWKRLELQMRIDTARVNMPQSVRFRLFMDPEECVEAFEALDKKENKPDPNAAIRVGQTLPANAQSDSGGNLCSFDSSAL